MACWGSVIIVCALVLEYLLGGRHLRYVFCQICQAWRGIPSQFVAAINTRRKACRLHRLKNNESSAFAASRSEQSAIGKQEADATVISDDRSRARHE